MYSMNFMNFIFIFTFLLLQLKKICILKLIVALNFSLLPWWYLFSKFFFSLFYVYNFSSSFKYERKKKICSKHRVSIYAMIFVLLIHINSVTQKISHCKIIYQSQKRSLFFICKGKMCVNFLKYLFEFFSTNFIVIDVSRKQS